MMMMLLAVVVVGVGENVQSFKRESQ